MCDSGEAVLRELWYIMVGRINCLKICVIR